MNYLAHALLSPADDTIMVGNLIGDLVRSMEGLPPGIRAGVVLHRRIDSYANTHPAFQRSARRLAPVMGHYARAVIDIFYDHLLAADWVTYAGPGSLEAFVRSIDRRYREQKQLLPATLPLRWASVEWLTTYARHDGVTRALERLSQRSRRGANLAAALPLLDLHREGLKEDLSALLPDLQALVHAFSAA